jgi:hypothetical protein
MCLPLCESQDNEFLSLSQQNTFIPMSFEPVRKRRLIAIMMFGFLEKCQISIEITVSYICQCARAISNSHIDCFGLGFEFDY